jgi:hypothetical protein
VAGKTGTLIFELSYEGQTGTQSNIDKIWIDDIRLLSSLPLQAEQHQSNKENVGSLSTLELDAAASAANAWWVNLVEAPNGVATGNLGALLVSTNNLAGISEQIQNEHHQSGGNAGLGEGSFDNDSVLSDVSGFPKIAWANEVTPVGCIPSADELFTNSDTSLATDGHAVEAQSDTLLGAGQGNIVIDAGVRHVNETSIVEGVAFVDESAISVADFDVRFYATLPSGEGTGADLQVLDLEKISLL